MKGNLSQQIRCWFIKQRKILRTRPHPQYSVMIAAIWCVICLLQFIILIICLYVFEDTGYFQYNPGYNHMIAGVSSIASYIIVRLWKR